MEWGDFERQAPGLAGPGRERFDRTHVALLGTVREDGSPRISPVGPVFIKSRLVFGVMRSPKGDDLERDARCVLHSAIRDAEGSDGEFKIYGRAVAVGDPEILAAEGTWWLGRPADRFRVYSMDIDEAVLLSWDWKAERMRLRRWTADRGIVEGERSYP